MKFFLTVLLLLTLCGCSKREEGKEQKVKDESNERIEIVIDTIDPEESLQTETETEQINIEQNMLIESLEGDSVLQETDNKQEQQNSEQGVIQTINGFQFSDGQSIPINVTFKMTNIQKGAEAYDVLTGNNAPSDIPEDKEYIIITFDITYNDGVADEINMTKNVCTLQCAKLHFNHANSDGNAEDVTEYLADNIYNLAIAKGCTGQGAVAFLHSKDSREPLYFSGFSNIISFSLAQYVFPGQAQNKDNKETFPQPALIAKVPVIPESAVLFEENSNQADFNAMAVRAVEPVYEQEGTFGGSPVIWSTINDGNFLYFYYTCTYPEKLQPVYAENAIIGENIKLSGGLHVGMTAVEAESIIPGWYHFKWKNPEYISVLDWNPGGYPEGWCEQFPQILIAEIDNGSEMPLTIGLFLDEQEIIRAIAFNLPTAG